MFSTANEFLRPAALRGGMRRASPGLTLVVALSSCLVLHPESASGQALVDAQQPIVNGLPTSSLASTVALIDTQDRAACSATLIGCRTVLTAAHCVCEGSGADCQTPGPLLTPASELRVFSQHSGLYQVTSIRIPTDYFFGLNGDLAVLTLEAPMAGVRPTPLNTLGSPAHGSPGLIAGFGRDGDPDGLGGGIKREGRVVTSACGPNPEPQHICWSFQDPIGTPGFDSNTCQGDSGGPLFVDFGDGLVLAGVTSGGASKDCTPPDVAFDANVFHYRDWITSNAQFGLGQENCGGLPSALGPGTTVVAGSGRLGNQKTEQDYSIQVPPGTRALGVSLNGETQNLSGFNDFDLLVNEGSPPADDSSDSCSSILLNTNEFCGILDPEPGTWWLRAKRFSGEGDFQVTASTFADPPTCVADGDTACLLGGKFRVEGTMSNFDNPPVTFSTRVMNFTGGRAESDQAVFFESFTEGNFEVGVKMVDGCGFPEGHPLRSYWAFFGALTNADTSIEVEDTVTGEVYQWGNPAGSFPTTLGDTMAFPCTDGPSLEDCVPGPGAACLLSDRFRVTGSMKNFDSPPATFSTQVMTFGGSGRAESDQAVFFESFTAGNFEAGVKMVDACNFPQDSPFRAYWVFYGALTNAETRLTVTQVSTGATDEWFNPAGTFPTSEGRTNAFPCE